MQIQRDDGNYSVPVLACIHCPTVLRRGHTVENPWDGAVLLPGMRISPPGVVFPMAATIGQDLRKSKATFDPLDQGTIVGFLDEHSFKPVATISTVGSVERTAMNLSAGNPPDYTALWGDKANIGTTLATTVHTVTQAFTSGLNTEAAVILPRLLPLSSPCIIPP
jgi:hypothetical protein